MMTSEIVFKKRFYKINLQGERREKQMDSILFTDRSVLVIVLLMVMMINGEKALFPVTFLGYSILQSISFCDNIHYLGTKRKADFKLCVLTKSEHLNLSSQTLVQRHNIRYASRV